MTAPEPDFDVIVVGAGIAGCITAYQLARAGHSVALIERGEAPGTKNLSGGVLYYRPLLDVFPDLLTEAPIERRITRHVTQFLTPEASVGLDYADLRLRDNAVTVLRAPFDAWLADRAEQAGVFLMAGVRVDRLLTDDGRTVGVQAGDDELRARVVVAADGVNSFLAREAGLRPAPEPRQLALGVKAVVKLDESEIDKRFHCSDAHGAAYALVGDATQGVAGGGFLYTNRASLSVGVVLRLDDLVAQGKESAAVFEHLLAHPFVAPLLDGGEIVEYGSHLVPEGGAAMVEPLVGEGVLVVGDAAGLALNTGLTVRGMDLAAASAVAAARAVDEALAADDVSKESLGAYRTYLHDSFAGHDLATYAKAPAFLERPRLYGDYGQLAADALLDVFHHDATPRRRLARVALDAIKHSPIRLRDIVADAWAGVRSL